MFRGNQCASKNGTDGIPICRAGTETQTCEWVCGHGEGEGGANGASSTDIYTLSRVKQTARGKLPTAKGAQLGALW